MILGILLVLFLFSLFSLFWVLSIQKVVVKPTRKEKRKIYKQIQDLPYYSPSFVPVEDHIVPTHASQSNKMNNMIGNANSSQGVGPGLLEVVVPSDYYRKNKMPTEQTTRYWPSGSILPDYIFDY